MKQILLTFVLLIGIGAVGCKKDNTPEDPRIKFVGTYDGTLMCDGIIGALVNGMTSFVIAETSSSEDKVDITINSNPVIRLEAVVDGLNLMIDNQINGINISGVVYNMDAQGTLQLSADTKSINGPLSIVLVPADIGFPLSGDCTIEGTKQ